MHGPIGSAFWRAALQTGSSAKSRQQYDANLRSIEQAFLTVALADYYGRAALAASQVLGGFDAQAFEQRLNSVSIGIATSANAANSREGRLITDLTVRLLARLYPALDVWGPPDAAAFVERMRRVARATNPAIKLTRRGRADTGISVGDAGEFGTTVYAGSDGWDALISASAPQPVGTSANPLGPGVAACLASANVFRRIFLEPWESTLDDDLCLSAWTFGRGPTPAAVPNDNWRLDSDAVLVGVGAIGMAAAWACAHAPMQGSLHLVDPEEIELGNLQRYVLATRVDVGRAKVQVARRAFRGNLRVQVHQADWESFVSQFGYEWRYVLAALDSAADRKAVQASLPGWVANGWTQPGDLGVSVHPRFGSAGACLACLYLPDQQLQNEDELIAESIGVPHRVLDVRTLLHLGTPVPRALLEEVASALGRPRDDLLRFEDRPIRELYVQGICGGAVLPLGQAGRPRADVHVPLAHQSALAGLLLASALAREAAGGGPSQTEVARLDILRPIGTDTLQGARPRGDGRCICEDIDFRRVYESKYLASSGQGAFQS